MGCGSSSLKGEEANLNSQPVSTNPAGPRKVKTDFSSVDYDQDARKRRMTEYAPHEQPELVEEESQGITAVQHEEGYSYEGMGSSAGPNHNAMDNDPDTTLKPYQTFDGGDWDRDNQDPSSIDPTSNYAKDEFATINDPANPLNQQSQHSRNEPHHEHQDDSHAQAEDSDPLAYDENDGSSDQQQQEQKKSWLGQKYSQFQSSKRGQGPTDEEVKKWIGKDRGELAEWAKDRPGVAGNQPAGRVGTDSGLASGAPWT